MITTRKVVTTVSNFEIDSKCCDWCGKVGEKAYLHGDITTFRVEPSYGSTMYDGEIFTLEICDACIKKYIAPKATR